MEKLLYTYNTENLIEDFLAFGVDITYLVTGVSVFSLYENEDGIRYWDPRIAGDGNFYENLGKNKWYYPEDKKEYEVAISYLQPGPVLEVGSGRGYFADKIKDKDYVGIELSEEAIKFSKAKGHFIHKVDFQEYASANKESVSNVCSFQLLEHLKDPSTYFKSSFTVLQKNGRLITAVPAENSYMGAMKLNPLNAPPHHITRWTDKCLRNYPSKFGFQLIDLVHIPVEERDSNVFWTQLMDHSLSSISLHPRSSFVDRFIAKLVKKLFRVIACKIPVPVEFNIPGHSVVAVYQKK